MYEFHYDYIKIKYSNNSRPIFTDSESLIYEIKTQDVFEDISNNKIFWFVLVIIQEIPNIMKIQTN